MCYKKRRKIFLSTSFNKSENNLSEVLNWDTTLPPLAADLFNFRPNKSNQEHLMTLPKERFLILKKKEDEEEDLTKKRNHFRYTYE